MKSNHTYRPINEDFLIEGNSYIYRRETGEEEKVLYKGIVKLSNGSTFHNFRFRDKAAFVNFEKSKLPRHIFLIVKD